MTSTELTQATAPPKGPTVQTRAEADLLGAYRSRMLRLPGDLRWSIAESDRPQGRDLASLEARAASLRSFPPAPRSTIETMVSRLFLRFPQMAKASEQQVASYALDLAPFPMWAIAKGLSDIIGGSALKSAEFPPSSLQVRAAVERAVLPMREELASIDGLLGAQAIPDEEARISPERRRELAETLRQAMRVNAPSPVPPRPRDMRLPSSFDAAREQRDPAAPIEASPALAAVLGTPRSL